MLTCIAYISKPTPSVLSGTILFALVRLIDLEPVSYSFTDPNGEPL